MLRFRRRRRPFSSVGVVGAPSLIHPASVASSWQSGQTSTSSAPSDGAKLTARSPISNVRSQTAHWRVLATFVTLIRPPSLARVAQNPPKSVMSLTCVFYM